MSHCNVTSYKRDILTRNYYSPFKILNALDLENLHKEFLMCSRTDSSCVASEPIEGTATAEDRNDVDTILGESRDGVPCLEWIYGCTLPVSITPTCLRCNI